MRPLTVFLRILLIVSILILVFVVIFAITRNKVSEDHKVPTVVTPDTTKYMQIIVSGWIPKDTKMKEWDRHFTLDELISSVPDTTEYVAISWCKDSRGQQALCSSVFPEPR